MLPTGSPTPTPHRRGRSTPAQYPARLSPPPAPWSKAPSIPPSFAGSHLLKPQVTPFSLPLARRSSNHWPEVPVHFLGEFTTSGLEEAAASLGT